MTSYLLLIPGCGTNKEKMQSFVDGYIDMIDEFQSKPEIGQEGREASMAYINSGYTDLESAEKVKESFEKTIAHDESVLKKLDDLEKPDKDAEKTAGDLKKGVQEVNKGNARFAEDYGKTKDQTVEEREATAQNVQPAMDLWAKGLKAIIGSLEELEKYVKDNGLEGESEVKEWLDSFNEEWEMFKSYTSQ